MLDGLPILRDVGATTLVVLVVLMILTDRLVTRRRLEEARSDRDRALDANDKLTSAVTQLTRQNDEMLEHARTTNALLSALSHAREGPS